MAQLVVPIKNIYFLKKSVSLTEGKRGYVIFWVTLSSRLALTILSLWTKTHDPELGLVAEHKVRSHVRARIKPNTSSISKEWESEAGFAQDIKLL